MDLKNIVCLFIAFGFVLFFAQVYANGECNEQNGPAGAIWIENGYTCICSQTISMSSNGVQNTSYMAICSPESTTTSNNGGNGTSGGSSQSTNSNIATAGITEAPTPSSTSNSQNSNNIHTKQPASSNGGSSNLSTTDCKNQVQEYNQKIKNLYLPYASFIKEKQENIKNAKIEINKLLKEYNDECVLNTLQDREGYLKPTITGNLIVGNTVSMVNIVGSDQVMAVTIAEQSTVVETVEVDNQFTVYEDLVSTIENENNSFLTSVDARLDRIKTDTNLSTECLAIKEKIIIQKEIIKKNIWELNKFKEENTDLCNQIKELIRTRNQLLKECMGTSTISVDCEIPGELLDKLREIETKMATIKETMASDTTSSEDNYSKYTVLKEEYLAITNKIEAIKADCQIRVKVISGQESICEEKTNLLKDMDDLKRMLSEATNDEEAYQLKAKLEYLQQRFGAIVCADPELTDTEEVKSILVDSSTQDYLTECINNLVEKAAVDQEIATNACSQKYSQENKGYQERIRALEQKISDQQKIITNLESKILDIQEKIRTANSEDKMKFIEENADDLKIDTIAKIDKKIESLKKQIENIDSSSIDDAKKEEIIDSINNPIANLNMQKERIQNSETTNELKTYIVEAKNADEFANRTAMISGIKKQTTELERIINKHLTDNQNYPDLQLELVALKESISAISANSANTEITTLRNQYITLKEKVITSSQEVEVQ